MGRNGRKPLLYRPAARAALAVLCLGLPAGAGPSWIRLASPHFDLYTDAGERAGTQTLVRLEQIRQVFGSLEGSGRGSPLPVRVFLFHSEGDFRILRPAESSSGFFQGGPQRNYIVIRHSGAQTWRVVFHEYVHVVLNHSSVRLPRWLEEGTAEFYSTLEMDRGRLLIGKPVPEHVRTLRMAEWIPADVLQSVNKDSPYYNESAKVGVFYAQSWALVHMLNLSPRYRGRMAEFAALLDDAEPAEGAFEKAFGRTLGDAADDLRAYVAGSSLPVLEAGTGPLEAARVSEPRELSGLDADLARAELMIDCNRREAAEKIYRRLEREYPGAPEVETGLGALALSRGQYDEARQRLERAIARGSRDPQTFFEYAMLLRQAGGEPASVAENLRAAVKLNPNFAEAHSVLGNMLSIEKRYGEAVEHLRQAASILPRQATFWRALAVAYHHLGRTGPARSAAYRALQAAATEQEVEMAQAALRLIDIRPAAPPPKREAVTTPESWRPKQGDSRVDGMLLRIDCLEGAARFWVRTDERTVALFVRNPGEILLKNLSSMTFEFRCGPQKPRSVSVEYSARPDAKLATDGDVVAIEFR